MSCFITFYTIFWSINKTSSNYMTIFNNNTSTPSTITSSFFSYYTTNIHKILIIRNLIRFQISMIFNISILHFFFCHNFTQK